MHSLTEMCFFKLICPSIVPQLSKEKITYEEDDPAIRFSFINCIYLGSAGRKTNPEVFYESRMEGHKRSRPLDSPEIWT